MARHLKTDSPGHKTDLNILVPTLFHGHSLFTTHTDAAYKYYACNYFFIAYQPKVNQRKKNRKKYPPPSPQCNIQ